MKEMQTYVAPWVLPNEKLPVHFEWGDEEFDEIVLELPSVLEPAELFNVKKFEKKENKIIIKKLRANGYFGMNLKSKEIPEDALRKIPFSIHFKKGAKDYKKIKMYGTVVRPKLQFINVPSELELTDTIDACKFLRLEMKHSGSGNITITVAVTSGGKLISHHENIFRAIWDKLVKGEYVEDVDDKLIIDEEYVRKILEQFNQMIDTDMVPSGEPEESLEAIRDIFEEKGPEKFMKVIISTIQTCFIESFLEISDTYPSDHSSIRGGKTNAIFEGTLDRVEIEIKYEDTMNNSYEPLCATIKIKDERKKPIPICCPVEISIQPDYLKNLDVPMRRS